MLQLSVSYEQGNVPSPMHVCCMSCVLNLSGQDGMHQHEFISDAHRDAHEKAPPVSTDQVVDAIGRGLKRGMADFGIIVRLLLCCITHRPGKCFLIHHTTVRL